MTNWTLNHLKLWLDWTLVIARPPSASPLAKAGGDIGNFNHYWREAR